MLQSSSSMKLQNAILLMAQIITYVLINRQHQITILHLKAAQN
jgi:hypothetical protein